jgi:quercetin dioxygenase-like cupin family protein
MSRIGLSPLFFRHYKLVISKATGGNEQSVPKFRQGKSLGAWRLFDYRMLNKPEQAAATIPNSGSVPNTSRNMQRRHTMEIKRSGSQPSVKGPADWFTGTVRLDPLFQAEDPARATGASVTFEPGARTAWHTHPLGQILIVTAGCGRAQHDGGPIEAIRPGDVIRFQPGEKHWHGAAPTTSMTHIAIQEQRDGKAVDWLEKVSDGQYSAKPDEH